MKIVDDALLRGSSPQIARDCPTPCLEDRDVALCTVESVSTHKMANEDVMLVVVDHHRY
jgi:hypothetical protein